MITRRTQRVSRRHSEPVPPLIWPRYNHQRDKWLALIAATAIGAILALIIFAWVIAPTLKK